MCFFFSVSFSLFIRSGGSSVKQITTKYYRYAHYRVTFGSTQLTWRILITCTHNADKKCISRYRWWKGNTYDWWWQVLESISKLVAYEMEKVLVACRYIDWKTRTTRECAVLHDYIRRQETWIHIRVALLPFKYFFFSEWVESGGVLTTTTPYASLDLLTQQLRGRLVSTSL